jgi:hypothetical protein
LEYWHDKPDTSPVAHHGELGIKRGAEVSTARDNNMRVCKPRIEVEGGHRRMAFAHCDHILDVEQSPDFNILDLAITHQEARTLMNDYRAIALEPADIARAVRQLIDAPASVDTSEITIRPTASAH